MPPPGKTDDGAIDGIVAVLLADCLRACSRPLDERALKLRASLDSMVRILILARDSGKPLNVSETLLVSRHVVYPAVASPGVPTPADLQRLDLRIVDDLTEHLALGWELATPLVVFGRKEIEHGIRIMLARALHRWHDGVEPSPSEAVIKAHCPEFLSLLHDSDWRRLPLDADPPPTPDEQRRRERQRLLNTGLAGDLCTVAGTVVPADNMRTAWLLAVEGVRGEHDLRDVASALSPWTDPSTLGHAVPSTQYTEILPTRPLGLTAEVMQEVYATACGRILAGAAPLSEGDGGLSLSMRGRLADAVVLMLLRSAETGLAGPTPGLVDDVINACDPQQRTLIRDQRIDGALIHVLGPVLREGQELGALPTDVASSLSVDLHAVHARMLLRFVGDPPDHLVEATVGAHGQALDRRLLTVCETFALRMPTVRLVNITVALAEALRQRLGAGCQGWEPTVIPGSGPLGLKRSEVRRKGPGAVGSKRHPADPGAGFGAG